MNQTLSDFGIDGNFHTHGLYLRQRPSGKEGFTWKLGYGAVSADVTISRGLELANTEEGRGKSSISSESYMFELGYQFARGAFDFKPWAAVKQQKYLRDAYDENSGASFPLSYDKHSQEAVIATLGLNTQYYLNDRSAISLDVAVDFDLSRSDNFIAGRSDIPGLETFSASGANVKRDMRAKAAIGYRRMVTENAMFDVKLGVVQTPYHEEPSRFASIGYQMNF